MRRGGEVTRLRDQNKADLALAALTLTVTAAAVGYETARWVSQRFRVRPREWDKAQPRPSQRRR